MNPIIRVRCNGCGQKIKAPAAMAGRDTSCPRCNKTLTIGWDISPPDEDVGESSLHVTPPNPEIVAVPTTPVIENVVDDKVESKPGIPAGRTIAGIDFTARAFYPQFPNLSRYLVILEAWATISAGAVVLAGLFNVTFYNPGQSDDAAARYSLTVMVPALLLAAMVYIFSMAYVEMIRVVLQIEANTRNFMTRSDNPAK